MPEPPLPPLRVLYVDDDAVNLRLVARVFAAILHEPEPVVAVRHPEEALALLAERTFDVVITDRRMPDMDGLELLEHVRKRLPGAARVLMTGYTEDAQVAAAAESGLAHAVISKPWSSRDLQRALQRVLARRDAARS